MVVTKAQIIKGQPEFGHPVLLAFLAGGAGWAALMYMATGAIMDPQAKTDDQNGLGLLITQPLIHVVLVPTFFFAAYACIQVFGYIAEKSMLWSNQSAVARIFLRAAGRRTLIDKADGWTQEAYLKAQRRTDALLFRPIEFGVGALTMLGLLGTIVGLSFALADLPAVLDPDAGTEAKQQVLGSLGFAFVTTIIGIVGSLLLSLARLYLTNMADHAQLILESRERD